MNPHGMLTLAAAGLIGFCTASNTRADETLKFRVVFHATSVQTQEVGDVEGHVLGLARLSGLVLFPDGSVGTTSITSTNDYIKGAGINLIYYNVTLKDGSALWYKVTGTAKPDGATTIFPEAPVTVLGGKGRFEGAKGDGTLSGVRLAAFGAGAELYADVVVNVKK